MRARREYDDLVVVNCEPYNFDATKIIFENLAPVYEESEVKAEDADLQIGTYFCYRRKFPGLPKAYNQVPEVGKSEVEFNMLATGLPFTDEDFKDVGNCLAHIEKVDGPDVILHDGFNKKMTGRMGSDKWRAKSYAKWSLVANILKDKGFTVGSIGSADEYIDGTENLTGLELQDSIALMKSAKVVLCNDTGTFHLCNLVGTPNIPVFTFTEDVKNFDKRFHIYSTMVRSNVQCSPCQGKGKHFWYYNKRRCHWACREAVEPGYLVDLAMMMGLTKEKEMSDEKNSVLSNEDTIADLRERFLSGKPFNYMRFGDADLYFINNPKFDKNRRHDANPAMSAELELAFSIEDPDYLIGCAAGGAVFAKDAPLRAIAEKYHKGKEFHSAVAMQLLYMRDPEGFVSFCKDCFWGKKVLIIGGESVATNPLVQKAFNVKASIKLTDRNAYAELNSKMEHIENNIPHFDIVVSALGQATRVLGYRLWKAGHRTQYFDVGSVVDALSDRPLRTWIKRVPELREKYLAAFGQ